MISSIFNTIFYEPLLNGLVFLIGVVPFHDVGIAVVVLTVIVRLIIFPFTHKATVTQSKIKQLEPELKEIKEKFKKDNQEQSKKIMALYKEHGINPFTGFVTLLVQIPIIFALWKVFLGGVIFDQSHLYSFIKSPEFFRENFLGIINMGQKSYILAVFASLSQFIQMKFALPAIKKPFSSGSFKENLARSMSIQFKYVMPVIIFFIALQFASAVALYWTTMNIFAIVHEMAVKKRAEKIFKNNGGAKKNNQIAFRNTSGKTNH